MESRIERNYQVRSSGARLNRRRAAVYHYRTFGSGSAVGKRRTLEKLLTREASVAR